MTVYLTQRIDRAKAYCDKKRGQLSAHKTQKSPNTNKKGTSVDAPLNFVTSHWGQRLVYRVFQCFTCTEAGTLAAAMVISLPVCGLRPVRL